MGNHFDARIGQPEELLGSEVAAGKFPAEVIVAGGALHYGPRVPRSCLINQLCLVINTI